jgi:hypothetical protein
METDQRLHLEFIQNVVARMNSNSFQIKEWMLTIVSAFLALYAATKNCYFVLIGVVPVIGFWVLDSYYLNQERKFRGLYNDVAGVSKEPKKIKPFEMRPDLYVGGEYSYWAALLSGGIVRLYVSLVVLLVGVFWYVRFYVK